ncbi:hypothetical protein [Urechidicola croceus]|uniref:Phenylalanyl-tRNA synthetase subunit alpha n=1 Tax=Urechidicola croceus TaxID=1850246 RepID=A0A1D8P936_9FLAO|nr:hypothetical protein [Urechidicola croceus]AOW21090.1 hypothetical protein LPB138_10550 [Urechidicola croceus]
MKKDIKIPKVTNVELAIVKEFNSTYQTDDWNVYIINNKPTDLEMVLIVSHGYDDKDQTSLMRHKIEKLPANSYAKIELIQPEIFKLNNEFKVSFFEDNQLKDKTYTIPKNTIKDGSLRVIKELDKKGIVIK